MQILVRWTTFGTDWFGVTEPLILNCDLRDCLQQRNSFLIALHLLKIDNSKQTRTCWWINLDSFILFNNFMLQHSLLVAMSQECRYGTLYTIWDKTRPYRNFIYRTAVSDGMRSVKDVYKDMICQQLVPRLNTQHSPQVSTSNVQISNMKSDWVTQCAGIGGCTFV